MALGDYLKIIIELTGHFEEYKEPLIGMQQYTVYFNNTKSSQMG